jgi:5-methylcytosine-specific restriction endonuclease McrA
MIPSIQEAINSAKFIKSSKQKEFVGIVTILLLFLLSAFLATYTILFIIYASSFFFAAFMILQYRASDSREPHEEKLIEFAKERNWYYPVETKLRDVSDQQRRVHFYSSMPHLLSIDDIIDRILSNDFAVRNPQPTAEIPSKQSLTPIREASVFLSTDSEPTLDSSVAIAAGATKNEVPELPDNHPSVIETAPIAREIERVNSNLVNSKREFQNENKAEKIDTDLLGDVIPSEEGARKVKTRYARVRSAKLREAAIKIHGRDCCVCGTNFDKKYGKDLSRGYIEVHHLKQIAGGVRQTNPVTDLVTLCSNCHKMADRLAQRLEFPPSTIDDLRKLLFPGSNE